MSYIKDYDLEVYNAIKAEEKSQEERDITEVV